MCGTYHAYFRVPQGSEGENENKIENEKENEKGREYDKNEIMEVM